MVSFAERAMAYNVLNAPIRPYPYPHIYVPEVFPPEYYAEMQRNMPRHEAMAPIGEVRPVSGYNERFVLQLLGPMDGLTAPQAAFWDDFGRWLLSGRFRDLLLMKFRAQVSHRFQGIADVQFRDEAMLVEDQTNYALGPHTDTPAKVVTVPRTAVTYSLYGDSVYVLKPQEGQPAPAKPEDTVYVVERRFIKSGQVRDDRVAVTSGLKEGEHVVTTGQVKLANGSLVKVDNSQALVPPATRPYQ